jgi:hypothetical protein
MSLTIDQIAFHALNEDDEKRIKIELGLQDAEWIEDIVEARGTVKGRKGKNIAKLLFNEDYGIQVEIIRYLEGPNYAEDIPGGEIAHIGCHWDGVGRIPTFPGVMVQNVRTVSHTNEEVNRAGRRYHYTIFDSRPMFGVHFKVIAREQM